MRQNFQLTKLKNKIGLVYYEKALKVRQSEQSDEDFGVKVLELENQFCGGFL